MLKPLLKIIALIAILIVILLVASIIWMYFRSMQPMTIPEARSITFWQFIRERWSAWREADQRVSSLPGYSGCKNDIVRFFWINLRSSLNYAYACVFPNSSLADAFRYWEQRSPDPILPTVEEISWFDAPHAFWKYFEAAYWRGLVQINYRTRACSLGPINFEEILGGAE